jgi:hypothetical protein
MCALVVLALQWEAISAQELRELAGDPVLGKWEPAILEHGLADPSFLDMCGIQFAVLYIY